ncbi:hypothetical protein T439DRAFT_329228 [Meredithblackwellia eburnea MCA 4105]
MVPAEELPVLESLVHIRNRLTKLKKDRTEYIRARDVLDIYKALLNEVDRLNGIRSPSTPSASTSTVASNGAATSEADASSSSSATPAPPPAATDAQPAEENRVDTILNDVFQLLSLFFLRIGKARESPATFCQLATMKRLLMHLKESGIYTEGDLKPFQHRLAELKEIIDNSSYGHDEDVEDDKQAGMTKLMLTKWGQCDRLLAKLSSSLVRLSPELVPLQQRLIILRRSLAGIASRVRPLASDIANILTELRAIEDRRSSTGKFLAVNEETGEEYEPPLGQELCAGLLEDNFDICQEIQARDGAEDVARGPLQPIYDRLSELRAQLERLVLTHRWTLRETDLYNYQMALQEIDNMRVDGKFTDSEGNRPEGQLVLLYLLRRCYGLCYRLMASSEPISEELQPISNKLATIKRCLIEVSKYGGPYSPRDLYPYQMALAQIDDLRKDGKFEGRDGSIPEGQGILNALLSEAHEIVSVMQEESSMAEEKEEREKKKAAGGAEEAGQ